MRSLWSPTESEDGPFDYLVGLVRLSDGRVDACDSAPWGHMGRWRVGRYSRADRTPTLPPRHWLYTYLPTYAGTRGRGALGKGENRCKLVVLGGDVPREGSGITAVSGAARCL